MKNMKKRIQKVAFILAMIVVALSCNGNITVFGEENPYEFQARFSFWDFVIESSDGTRAVIEDGKKVEGDFEISDGSCPDIGGYTPEFYMNPVTNGAIYTIYGKENREKMHHKSDTSFISFRFKNKMVFGGQFIGFSSKEVVQCQIDSNHIVTGQAVSGVTCNQTIYYREYEGFDDKNVMFKGVYIEYEGKSASLQRIKNGVHVYLDGAKSTDISLIDARDGQFTWHIDHVPEQGFSVMKGEDRFYVVDDFGTIYAEQKFGYSVKIIDEISSEHLFDAYLEPGTKLEKPVLTEKRGYIFDEWHCYKETPLDVWDFDEDVVTEPTTIRVRYKEKPVNTVKKLSIKKKTKAFTLNWNPVEDCDGYYIQYATKKNFSDAKTKKVLVGKNPKAKKSLTVNKLKKSKTYYVRIRAYRIAVDKNLQKGKYSTVKTVKITK